VKLAIMQPYLFPYLGYFQLIHAVDTFVIYDDVNFITRGWINRNNILAQGNKQLVTLPVVQASHNKLINELEVVQQRDKLLKSIIHAYKKAPFYNESFRVIEDILLNDEKNLSKFLDYSLKSLCSYLGLDPDWKISSDIEKDNSLKGPDKILEICKKLSTTHYVNLPGGKELYDKNDFSNQGIELSFIEPGNVQYPQKSLEFVSNLSIIDVMMQNHPEQFDALLREYHLV